MTIAAFQRDRYSWKLIGIGPWFGPVVVEKVGSGIVWNVGNGAKVVIQQYDLEGLFDRLNRTLYYLPVVENKKFSWILSIWPSISAKKEGGPSIFMNILEILNI